MAKKVVFIIMIFLAMLAGAVISMADDDNQVEFGQISGSEEASYLSDIPLQEVQEAEEDQSSEEYPYQDIIDKYGSLILDKNNVAEGVLLKEITIHKNKSGTNTQDFSLSATVNDEVQLADGDFIIVMVFVEVDESYKFMGTPLKVKKDLMRPYKIQLPITDDEQTYNIRVVAFLNSGCDFLKLGENLEISDIVYTLSQENFNVKNSLKNSWDLIEQIKNILLN